MNDNPFFSLIIPAYNRADLLTRAIESVLDQQYSNVEIIIVDDGSTDNTEEVVAAFSHTGIRYIKKANEERSIARNTGIHHARGKYISFLDSDDYLYPNHFQEAHTFITKAGDPEVFHLNFEFAYPLTNEKVSPSLPETVNEIVLTDNKLSCNGVFIRRDIANLHKFIHHRRATYAEDTELWIRLGSRYVFHHLPVVTSAILMHEERSAHIVKPQDLLKSTLLVRKSLFEDEMVIRHYGLRAIQRFIAKRFLLCAVLFSEADKSWAISLLRRALFSDIHLLRSKSFFVVLRNLLFR